MLSFFEEKGVGVKAGSHCVVQVDLEPNSEIIDIRHNRVLIKSHSVAMRVHVCEQIRISNYEWHTLHVGAHTHTCVHVCDRISFMQPRLASN